MAKSASASYYTNASTFNPEDQRWAHWQRWALGQEAPALGQRSEFAQALASAQPAPGSGTGVFGVLPPEALLGLSPEQVSEVSRQRTENEYRKALTTSAALEFARKMSGQDLADDLTKLNVEGGIRRDITGMSGAADLAKTAMTAKLADERFGWSEARGESWRRVNSFLEWKQQAAANKDNPEWAKKNPRPAITVNDLSASGILDDISKDITAANTMQAQRDSYIKAGIDPKTVDFLIASSLSKSKSYLEGPLGDLLKEVGMDVGLPKEKEEKKAGEPTGKKPTGKTWQGGKYKEFSDGKTFWIEDAQGDKYDLSGKKLSK